MSNFYLFETREVFFLSKSLKTTICKITKITYKLQIFFFFFLKKNIKIYLLFLHTIKPLSKMEFFYIDAKKQKNK